MNLFTVLVVQYSTHCNCKHNEWAILLPITSLWLYFKPQTTAVFAADPTTADSMVLVTGFKIITKENPKHLFL